ncbi:MAG: aldo/keto reductase, partial [Akkermansia sp.]
YYGTYRAMEEAYRAGKIRALGVSNFYPARFIDLAEFCEVKPAVNQMETHVFHQQVQIREVMKKYGTRLESWGPFAEGRNGFFDNEVLKAVGAQYGRTAAQVALRFLVQQGIIAIPKSTHRERMVENFNIFDFELSPQDMKAIAALDRGESLFFSHEDPATVEFLINYGK